MIRKIFIGILIAVFAVFSVWLGYYFYKKSKKDPIVYKTEKPFVTDITRKAVATGSIVPRREVDIKPQASGIIEALFVEAGDFVKEGQLVARVRLVQSISGKNSDQISLNSANNNYQTAQVNLKNSKTELDRQKQLYDQKVISQQAYLEFQLAYNLNKEALQAART